MIEIAKKKVDQDKNLEEIKKLTGQSRFIIGTKRSIDLLKLGKLEKIFMSSNCPDSVKSDIKRYCGLGSCECVELGIPNVELGALCKRRHHISVAGVQKDE